MARAHGRAPLDPEIRLAAREIAQLRLRNLRPRRVASFEAALDAALIREVDRAHTVSVDAEAASAHLRLHRRLAVLRHRWRAAWVREAAFASLEGRELVGRKLSPEENEERDLAAADAAADASGGGAAPAALAGDAPPAATEQESEDEEDDDGLHQQGAAADAAAGGDSTAGPAAPRSASSIRRANARQSLAVRTAGPPFALSRFVSNRQRGCSWLRAGCVHSPRPQFASFLGGTATVDQYFSGSAVPPPVQPGRRLHPHTAVWKLALARLLRRCAEAAEADAADRTTKAVRAAVEGPLSAVDLSSTEAAGAAKRSRVLRSGGKIKGSGAAVGAAAIAASEGDKLRYAALVCVAKWTDILQALSEARRGEAAAEAALEAAREQARAVVAAP